MSINMATHDTMHDTMQGTLQGSMRNPTSRSVFIRDKLINVYVWPALDDSGHDNSIGDPIVFLHATGFHARCWDKIIRQLPNNAPIFAIDALSHGKSDSIDPPYHWHRFAEYTEEVITELGISNITIVGHSFGGHLATLLAASKQKRFKQLLLLDPVIGNPDHIKLWQSAASSDNPVAKRRNQWASANELREKLGKKPPFNDWDKDVLKDYCEFGLTKTNEGYKLACPPACEAAIYGIVGGDETYSKLANIQTPTFIIRARSRTSDDALMDFRPSPTWEKLTDQLPNAKEIHCTKRSHFFPMEDPDFVATLINELYSSGTIEKAKAP